jgi:hypothetical protein
MKKYVTYNDPDTGYEIRQYTKGPERNTKLYFTTENFTADDRFFFFYRQHTNGTKNELYQDKGEIYKADVESGEIKMAASNEYSAFAMDRFENYGVLAKGNTVCRYDCDDDRITELGALPDGGHITGHLTISRGGMIVCSYQQRNCIYSLVMFDPKTGKSEVVYQSDYNIGHAQVCPTDENTIFFIHETGGDALQRMWLYDVTSSTAMPYYVEHTGEWITHEVWTADGENIVFMKLPYYIMIGTKDGHNFRVVSKGEHYLHSGVSRDSKWFCPDSTGYLGVESPTRIYLVNGETGNSVVLANTDAPKSGADHLHPSFNRKGNMILFNHPFENGATQVCLIDLNQVERP